VMMVAMMTPCLAPMLVGYQRSLHANGRVQRVWLTVLAGVGYFAVWGALGLVVYPLGAGLAQAALRWGAVSRAIPVVSGAVLLIAGALQFTRWKARQLGCCRDQAACACPAAPKRRSALLHGVRLGWRCCRCCSGFMAMLLALGMMEPLVMGGGTAAIAAERLLPWPRWTAWIAGAGAIVAGAWTILQAIGAK
jgi:predicted metal-binding membrane protein